MQGIGSALERNAESEQDLKIREILVEEVAWVQRRFHLKRSDVQYQNTMHMQKSHNSHLPPSSGHWPFSGKYKTVYLAVSKAYGTPQAYQHKSLGPRFTQRGDSAVLVPMPSSCKATAFRR